jgi:hypothetical protein
MQHQQRQDGDQQVDDRRAQVEGERHAHRTRGDVGHAHQLGQLHHRHQGGRLDQHLPDVAEPRDGEAPDLGQHDPPEGQRPAHPRRVRRLDLAAIERLESAAEHLGRERAVDHAKGQRAGGERVDVDHHLAAGREAEQALQQDRDAVVDQEDQHELGHAAHDRRVGAHDAAGERVAGQLAPGAEQPER